MKEEDHQRKEGIQTETEDLQEEEDYTIMEDPQIDMEATLVEEDHLMEQGQPDGNRGPPQCPD